MPEPRPRPSVAEEMEPSSRAEVERAIQAGANQARMDLEAYERKLREKPFWRFRRRRAIGRKIADARLREQEALRLLQEGR
jgi:hypothetical protein